MFRLLIAFTCLIVAFSFAPAGKVARSATLMATDFSKAVGVQPPLGLWDPLGVLKGADEATFEKLRGYEVKHGRVAMLAIVGHIMTTAGGRCAGEIAPGVPFSSVKNGLAAFDTIPVIATAHIIGFVGLLEFGYEYQAKNIAEDAKQRMTDFGWSEETQKRKAAIELNNGRAAQMGILTLMVHEKLNNNPYILNSLFGAPVAFNQ